MTRITLIALFGFIALFLVNVSASGEVPLPKRNIQKEVGPKEKKERLLVFTSTGPVVIDFHVFVNEKPYQLLREQLIRDVLKQSDTNNDGQSTWKEATSNPHFLVDFTRYRGKQLDFALKRYDKNQNGLLEKNEAVSMVIFMAGGEQFSVTNGFKTTAPEIKKLIDVNRDDVLSKREIDNIAEVLRQRDTNENELIEQTELPNSLAMPRNFNDRNSVQNSSYRNRLQSSLVFYLDEMKVASNLYQVLKKRYSDDKDRISQLKMKRMTAVWNTLDKNKNQILDRDEVKFFHTIQPHAVFHVYLGSGKKAGVELKSVANEFKQVSVTKDKTSYRLSFSGLHLVLHASASPATTTNLHTQSGKRIIQQFDTDKNGYLEEKELKNINQATYYLRSFKRWDANADGKVYADEIAAVYNKAYSFRQSRIVATTHLQKQMLFTLLDETGDNRLSPRELSIAQTRILSIDKNQDGKITPEEMPQSLMIFFSRGHRSSATSGFNQGIPRRTTSAFQQPRPQLGPRWFVHMDKNGDGDISPREFLGKAEVFKKLDRNHDGFIEKKEAEAAKTN